MLQIEGWKRVAIWLTIALGLAFAMPNFFYGTVERSNDAEAAIEALGATPERLAEAGEWPSFLPDSLVNLGLDLRGGAHLLAEVHVEDVYAERMDALWPEVRDALRDERDTVGTIRRQDGPADELRVRISQPEGLSRAVEVVRDLATPTQTLTGLAQSDIEVAGQGETITVTLSEAERDATDNRTIQQSLEIIRRRVDEVGTREPTIQRQGQDRILIQVPGIGSAEELKALIGTTAKLTFHPVIGRTSDPEASPGARNLLLPSMDEPGTWYIVEETPVVSGGIITGQFSVEESTQLAVLLRAGALPAEMTFLEERTVGPELGQDSIEAGSLATLVAFAAVLVFMWLSYGLFGLFANIALIINIGLLFGLLSLIGATLTLPGIAGIVLTVGMAVDANVLVFERIREELKTAKGPARAIELGYEKALSAIIDANITTFITAVILFTMGSGPVRGFSVTLGLGIITSVFTAIFVTRLLVVMWFERRRPKTIEV